MVADEQWSFLWVLRRSEVDVISGCGVLGGVFEIEFLGEVLAPVGVGC